MARKLENRICPVCGKEFKPTTTKQVCCSSKCSQKKWRIMNGYQEGSIMQTTKKCIICGTEFKPSKSTVVCCSESCKKKRQRENEKAKHAEYREEQKKSKKKKTNHKQLADIAIDARKEGLTYGQYVVKYGL